LIISALRQTKQLKLKTRGNEMELLTPEDIEGLYRNGSISSIHKLREFYERLKGKESDIPKDGEGFQMLYSNRLNALISYNYFKTKYKTVLFSDSSDFLGPDTYCIVVNTQAINGNAWMD